MFCTYAEHFITNKLPWKAKIKQVKAFFNSVHFLVALTRAKYNNTMNWEVEQLDRGFIGSSINYTCAEG